MSEQVRDYFAVAVRVAARRYRSLLKRFREDVIQECHLLAWEAQSRGCIVVKNGAKRRRFGNGKRMGLRSYTKAVQARLCVFRKQYTGHHTYKEIPWNPQH